MTETTIEKTGERRYTLRLTARAEASRAAAARLAALDPARLRAGTEGATLADLRAILADVLDAQAARGGGGW